MKTTELIAVNLGHKNVAVKAEIIEIHGFNAGVHKTIGKTGNNWTVTAIGTGIAFAKSSVSRSEAIALAAIRIENAGVGLVESKLKALPLLPHPSTLETYVEPPKDLPADIETIVDTIAGVVGLNQKERDAVRFALSSRSGQLKAKCPSAFGNDDEKLACAAWQGLQPNPFKVSVGTCLFLRGEAKELFEKLVAHQWPAALDKDCAKLEKAGVW